MPGKSDPQLVQTATASATAPSTDAEHAQAFIAYPSSDTTANIYFGTHLKNGGRSVVCVSK